MSKIKISAKDLTDWANGKTPIQIRSKFSRLILPVTNFVEKNKLKLMFFFYSEADDDFLGYRGNMTKEDIAEIITELQKLINLE
jgi:hypothetical protein